MSDSFLKYHLNQNVKILSIVDGFVLFALDDEFVLEGWGASTKHPDIVERFSNYKNRACYDSSFEGNAPSWLLHIAADMMFPWDRQALIKMSQEFEPES